MPWESWGVVGVTLRKSGEKQLRCVLVDAGVPSEYDVIIIVPPASEGQHLSLFCSVVEPVYGIRASRVGRNEYVQPTPCLRQEA